MISLFVLICTCIQLASGVHETTLEKLHVVTRWSRDDLVDLVFNAASITHVFYKTLFLCQIFSFVTIISR